MRPITSGTLGAHSFTTRREFLGPLVLSLFLLLVLVLPFLLLLLLPFFFFFALGMRWGRGWGWSEQEYCLLFGHPFENREIKMLVTHVVSSL